jgi:epoxyqueuosine reductase
LTAAANYTWQSVLICLEYLAMAPQTDLMDKIKTKATQLGFVLAGVTTPDPPPHLTTFENWLTQGRHGTMDYLATERSRTRRADPRQILPGCQSILVLATPYDPPLPLGEEPGTRGQIAAYARNEDYHDVLSARMKELVQFIEEQVGGPVQNRWYTDTGPILERDLAQRAGLGWIGKNTCLIHPRHGSYFLLSEILLDLPLEPDRPFTTDHCGTCTRCIEACPTDCILPDRTLDARRCISYLTIELKDEIPEELRGKIGSWVFGCDICQQVCPWNRFAEEGDPAFNNENPLLSLAEELLISKQEFNQRFKLSPVKRAKRRGYLRNVAVAIGNTGDMYVLPVLRNALNDEEPLVREHAQWAIEEISNRENRQREGTTNE